jgi:hypothetical protein
MRPSASRRTAIAGLPEGCEPRRRTSMLPRRRLSGCLLLLASLGVSRVSFAEDGAELRARAHEWFDGERRSGFVWGGAGVLSLGAAAGLWRFGNGSDVERGMAYPLAAFGVLQTAIGIGSLARGHGREAELDALVARSPEEARSREIDRMRTLEGAFLAIEIAEVALLVGGATYAATRTREDQGLSRGVGLGLAMEGGLMLLLDSLAAARAHRYSGQLGEMSFSAVPAPGSQSVSFRGAF